MTPALVIFDCDGVLVDTETVGNTVIASSLSRCGLKITPDEAISYFAGGTIAAVAEEAERRGAVLPDNWVAQTYAEIFARLREGVAVINGVFPLIDRLDALGIARAVASNGPMEKMQITLGPSGLWDRFAGRIYSGHDHGPKPAPDMIYRIMADAGVTPAQTVMIDDMPSGCQAAHAAGIRCLGYIADGDSNRLEGTGAEPIHTMQAVAAALGLQTGGDAARFDG